MARTRKVTVTLPVGSVDAILGLVTAGQASSVSGFVQHAVQVSLDDVAGWGATLARALAETGGAMTVEEQQWADRILGGSDASGSAA